MLLLFLLVFSPASAAEEGLEVRVNNITSEVSRGWRCPNSTVKMTRGQEIHCHCELAHTLRCDGSISMSGRKSQMVRRLVSQLSVLPASQSITLLDISVQNLTKLPGKVFMNLNQSLLGLVISTGELAHVDKKAFYGLERSLHALGLVSNKLASIPVPALETLPGLTRLDLSSNRITYIDTMPRLPELEYLDLSQNNLTVVAGGWTQSTPNLRTLVLSGNNLTVSSLSQHSPHHLTYLIGLDLSHNQLTGELSSSVIDSMVPAGVKMLDLGWNKINGTKEAAFSHLTALTSLNLQGNKLEEIPDMAFTGLLSLTMLDLSYNSIISLGPASLSGLSSLSVLSLAHNHLQTVSPAWLAHPGPGLTQLLLMDNDISAVEDHSFDNLSNITEINLAGNLLACDCHLAYLHHYLTRSPQQLTNSSLTSAVCATPPSLGNAPLAQLPVTELTCEPEQEYYYSYEYYGHDNTTESSAVSVESMFMTSKEVHFRDFSYNSNTQELGLSWRLEEDLIPYKCDLLQVIQETDEGPSIKNANITCHVSSDSPLDSEDLHVILSLREQGLDPDSPHIYCVTLLHHGHVVPGCSGPITASEARDVPRVRITGLHGNVSVTHNMTVHVTARVPGNKLTSSEVRLSVSVPGQPPVREDSYRCEAEADGGHEAEYCDIKAMMSDLPPHSYYNVCAELSGDGGSEVLDSQCMILHTSTIVRYETRSVLSLLLTLIFLSLGIACLTVLYLIIKRHRSANTHTSRNRPLPRSWACNSLQYILGYWWNIASYKRNKLVDDFSEDEED